VCWKGTIPRLGIRIEEGLEVIATGRLTTYAGSSRYQIIVDRLELAGEGALLKLLEDRRKKLAAEGLFDAERKRALPFLPEVVGVVTSPTGAVIRDILHRLEDRCPTHVILWPVPVQGDGAAPQIAAAIRGFDSLAPGGAVPRPDLVIVARGGGSIEDLWAFSEEEVVRAVAACSIPIISAVGHETDTSLCDFAADLRAPTPTAAAEIAVPVRSELLGQLRELGSRAERCAARSRERAAEQLQVCLRHFPAPEDLLAPQRQRLDELGERLPRALSACLSHARAELSQAAGALRPSLLEANQRRSSDRLASIRLDPALVRRRIEDGRRTLEALWRIAALAHPNRPLEKGYVRVEDRSGHVLVSSSSARAAGRLRLVFGDGKVDARVTDGLERGKRDTYSKSSQPKLL
jgi:exodeoxyribonuclease VII large subunit